MGKVIVDTTMSLDGFVTGPNDGPGNGLGDGGRVLHEWVFEGRTDADAQLLSEEPMKTLGSCVLGRRTFAQLPMGANISQQYLKAGRVDEMEIHVANVLLVAGRPLFANIGDEQIKLERLRVIATPTVTHLKFRVVK